MNIAKKLHAFERILQSEAEEKKAALSAETAKEYERALSEIKREAEAAAEKSYRAECLKAERETNREALAASAASKKALIELRERLSDRLYKNVAARLRDFAASPAYPDYIVTVINEMKNNSAAPPTGIVLGRNDAEPADYIQDCCGLPVAVCGEDFIGGFKCVMNNNATLDMTFTKKLYEVRRDFKTAALYAGDGA